MSLIVFRGTRDEAEALIRKIPAMLAGTEADAAGITRPLQLRAGVALLSQIQQDFIVKSRGGTGRDGIAWPKLKPETIARRKATRAELKGAGINRKRNRLRPTLDAAQDLEWRRVFWRTFRAVVMDVGEKAAKGIAGAAAWKALKAQGAKTILELLGNRKVDILRDTGELFRSLTPGVADKPSGADGQVFELLAGKIIVGTNKKPWHHRGDPARGLPSRALWPLDDKIPDAWWPAIDDALATGIGEVAATILAGAN